MGRVTHRDTQMMMAHLLSQRGLGYRTADLVLHLDAIQNTRAGTHNASATVWEDLAGNMDIALYNATWGSNYCSFAGNVNSYGLGTKWTFTKGLTIETVFKFTARPYTYPNIAGWVKQRNSTGVAPSIYINGGYNFINFTLSLTPNGVFSVVKTIQFNTFYCFAGTSSLVLFDGSTYAHGNTFSSYTQTIAPFKLAAGTRETGDGNTELFTMQGNIYAVRVYDANLSAAELEAHWLIDKARFNIPD